MVASMGLAQIADEPDDTDPKPVGVSQICCAALPHWLANCFANEPGDLRQDCLTILFEKRARPLSGHFLIQHRSGCQRALKPFDIAGMGGRSLAAIVQSLQNAWVGWRWE